MWPQNQKSIEMKHLKQEFDKLSFKDTLMYSITSLSITAGFVLLFCGLLTPPVGEIHDSVLTAFGLVLLFVGAVFGLDLRFASQVQKLEQEIKDLLKTQAKEDDAKGIK